MDDPLRQVVGTKEARDLLGGISRERLTQLRQDPTFPKPVYLSGSPIWDRALVMAFQKDRTAGTRRLRMRVVRHYRMNGVVAAAARDAGVSTTTVRRWLYELGIPLPQEHARLLSRFTNSGRTDQPVDS